VSGVAGIKEQLRCDLTAAMKARDEVTVATLRKLAGWKGQGTVPF